MSLLAICSFRIHQSSVFRFRIFEEVLWTFLFDDPSAIHEDDAVGNLAGKTHFVRDTQHGHAGTGEADHGFQHFANHHLIRRHAFEDGDLGGQRIDVRLIHIDVEACKLRTDGAGDARAWSQIVFVQGEARGGWRGRIRIDARQRASRSPRHPREPRTPVDVRQPGRPDQYRRRSRSALGRSCPLRAPRCNSGNNLV